MINISTKIPGIGGRLDIKAYQIISSTVLRLRLQSYDFTLNLRSLLNSNKGPYLINHKLWSIPDLLVHQLTYPAVHSLAQACRGKSQKPYFTNNLII